MKNRVIIAGSRTCVEWDEDIVGKIANIMTHMKNEETEIVSGTCRGADKLGERVAIFKGYSVKKFPADWKLYGKSAGHIRNKEMAEYATHLIAIWDGESKGTKLMIDLAKENRLPVRIIKI